jgi:putative DNA primase/helicase
LNTPIPIAENGALTPALLSMSIEGQKAWVLFHNRIEQELRSGGDFYEVRDVASKIADNVARLAALFHLFVGIEGDIGLDALESAIQIATWHLNESKRFFGELSLPEEMANAIRLDKWLINYCRRNGSNIVSRREIQRGVTPVNLRQNQNLENVLNELAEADRILVISEGWCKNIYLNPALLKENSR